MELYKLRYFYEVAKLGHVTRAADAINIAQPALTQAIKSLEGELGVKLLAKKGRNVILTDYGVYLKEKLDHLLPQFDNIKEEINQMKGDHKKRIKLNILAASTFVINVIVRYREENPDVIFDFEQNEEKSDCDILITTNMIGKRDRPNYSERCIKSEEIYLAVPKNSKYAEMASLNLADMKEEHFVMLSSSRLFGGICNKFCALAGFSPKILFESDAPSAVQNIISTGSGIAFWPEYSWGKENNQNVVLRPISFPTCRRELIIELSKQHPGSEYAEDFYHYLIERLQ